MSFFLSIGSMLNRVVVLDTETTGISHTSGHRLIEIGCVELIDNFRTDKYFHVYINPCREISYSAFKVHGLTNVFLSDKPKFQKIAQEFLEFIGQSKIIIHNAPFDLGFINNELQMANFPPIDRDRVIDTLAMARYKFPGSGASLDALCKRFGISLDDRNLHGAMLDAKLLAGVYLEMVTGDQGKINFCSGNANNTNSRKGEGSSKKIFPSQEESLRHEEMLQFIECPIWKRYNHSFRG